MPYAVDFNEVSTVGLESSPVAPALAGLRANEARYEVSHFLLVVSPRPRAPGSGPLASPQSLNIPTEA